MTNPTLAAKGVTVTFSGIDVVDHVDIELRAGEVHAIVGENGAGKSSLAKAIAGVYKTREGRTELDGKRTDFKNPREALRAGVALIHQEPSTFPDLDVAENVFAGNLVKRGPFVNKKACEQRTHELLKALGADIDPKAKVSKLSVAQRQFVELASALAHDAKVWIFDETTAPLTPKETNELFDVIRRLKDQGCAIAFVSHHLHEVFQIADRITVIRDGKKIGEKKTSETTTEEIVRMMVGRDIEKHELRTTKTSEPALRLSGLSGPGFSSIDLTVHKGEIVALAGLVGAGRTELLRSLFGITRPTQGKIEIDGAPVKVTNPSQARSLGIALVPEDRIHDGLLLTKSVAFNSVLTNLDRVSHFGWVSNQGERDLATAEATRLNLAYRASSQLVGQLSGGNQQKVVLAKWLLTDPRVLLLDEPTRGVDIGAKHEVHKAIRDLADKGIAVLVASSDLPEVLALADRVAVMRKGTIVATLDQNDATEEKIIALATGESHG